MTRILFVENDNASIEDARQLIVKSVADTTIDIVGFEEAQDRIQSFEPDIVILDLEGVPDIPKFEGFEVRDFIWGSRFCPIVVYSAFAKDYKAKYEKHPLVKVVEKGSGSPKRVLSAVQELLPIVVALKEAQLQINQRFWESMKLIAPIAAETVPSPQDLADVIIRSGRRRVAAMMDISTQDEAPLASWEQYLYPPVSQDPELGDILKIASGDADDPASFSIVLTPSCDMVSSDGRSPKVSEVLTATCISIHRALEKINMLGNGNDRHKRRLRTTLLSQGFYQDVIPLPSLAGAIPAMAADLRDLRLIPLDEIGSDAAFCRVAAIDSPFRETVAWAYMQISSRPGLPERELSSWTDEIVQAMRAHQDSEQE